MKQRQIEVKRIILRKEGMDEWRKEVTQKWTFDRSVEGRKEYTQNTYTITKR